MMTLKRLWRLDKRVLDLVGPAALIALSAWSTLVAYVTGTSAAPIVITALVVVFAWVGARLVGRYSTWQVPLVLTLGAVATAVSSGTFLVDRTTGPLGYANATASFYLLAAVAAVIVAIQFPLGRMKDVAAITAVALAAVPWLNASRAGAMLTCLIPLGLVCRTPRAVRALLAAGLTAVLGVIVVTVALGWAYQPDTGFSGGIVGRVFAGALSGRRLALWSEALDLVASRPVTGVGIDRFMVESSVARIDPDTGWAHSGYLQMAAEAGLPGAVLLVSVVIWGFARLWVDPHGTQAALSAVAWIAASAHISVDYLLHFPAIPVFAIVLLASGCGPTSGSPAGHWPAGEPEVVVHRKAPVHHRARRLLERLVGGSGDRLTNPAASGDR